LKIESMPRTESTASICSSVSCPAWAFTVSCRGRANELKVENAKFRGLGLGRWLKAAMLRLVSGGSSTEVKFDQLKEILVPLPEDDDFDLIVDEIEALHAEVTEIEARLNEKRTDLRGKYIALYGGVEPGQRAQ
jgi:hypothetical protein